ncbi:MAG TPA: hypothetical protein VNY73_01070, partial [Bacteroidia bacterium]|nr:hypothetical protein [Bacteroidia bacterium]
FRHAFAMAYMCRYVSVKKLRRLGKAHEKGNYLQFLNDNAEDGGELPDSLSSVMDLNNNELGFLIGKEAKRFPAEELKKNVIDGIQKGKALIMKRNKEGLYLDCGGHIISRQRPYKQWVVPKCLVPSKD